MKKFFIIGFIFVILAIFPFRAVALTVSPVRLEVSGEPGQTLTSELTLINEEREVRTFYSSLENFEARGETGRPYFTPGTEGLATWMEIPKEVTLEPGETKTIPFKIEIPQNTEPGGYFAAIFWGSQPPEVKEGGQIMVGTKTGILVLLSVPGEIKGGGGLLEFSTKDKEKFFNSLPITFIYRFQNTSTDRIKPEGEIEIKNIFGKISVVLPANKVEGNVLPRSIRKFEVIWEETPKDSAKAEPTGQAQKDDTKIGFFGAVKKQWSNFHFGRYNAELNLKYGIKNEEARANYGFYIIPWQLLSVIIVIFVIIGFLGFKGIKRYNQWIIKKAQAR